MEPALARSLEIAPAPPPIRAISLAHAEAHHDVPRHCRAQSRRRRVVQRHAPERRSSKFLICSASACHFLDRRHRYRQPRPRSRAFVFGLFGYLRESKRLTTVLNVFDRVRREAPHATLLVAGHSPPDLERATAELLRGPGIVRLPTCPTAISGSPPAPLTPAST